MVSIHKTRKAMAGWVFFRKGFIQSILTALSIGLFSAVTYAVALIFETTTGYSYVWPIVIALIVLTFVFDPMKGLIEKFVDRYVFTKEYGSRLAIQEFARMAATILDMDLLLNETSNRVMDIADCRWAFMLIPEVGGDRYTVGSYAGLEDSMVKGLELKKDSSLVKKLKREGKPVVAKDSVDTLFHLSIPLIVSGRLVAILVLGEKTSGEPHKANEISLFNIFASELAIAIENARLYRLEITDSLTKLYHRSYFDIRLGQEIDRACRFSTGLSIILVDVDGFLAYRMANGRMVAEQTLIDIGRIVREAARDFDVPARFGEDEFALILPDLSEDQAQFIARSIKKRVVKERMMNAEKSSTVSVSVGVAELINGTDNPETLVLKAEADLYRNKKDKRHLAK